MERAGHSRCCQGAQKRTLAWWWRATLLGCIHTYVHIYTHTRFQVRGWLEVCTVQSCFCRSKQAVIVQVSTCTAQMRPWFTCHTLSAQHKRSPCACCCLLCRCECVSRADSRLYGGVHFRSANVDGERLGRLVGGKVFDQIKPLPGSRAAGGNAVAKEQGPKPATGRRMRA